MCKLLILGHSIFSKYYPIKVKISFSVFLILSACLRIHGKGKHILRIWKI
jgi:hypothetical protein